MIGLRSAVSEDAQTPGAGPATLASSVPTAYDAIVEEIVTEAESVVTVRLRARTPGIFPQWSPGSHIDVVLPDGAERQYSLHGDGRAWQFSVLHQPDGRGGSAFIHDRLRAGDVLQVRGPRNNFPLIEAPAYLFIAGGIGITPFLSMIEELERRRAPWRLLYGGRRRESMAFVDVLVNYGDRVVIHPEDSCGLLDLQQALSAAEPALAVYCCGPEPLIAAVEARCAEQGTSTLHVERFAPRAPAEGAEERSFEVYLSQSDLTFTVEAGETILDAADACGASLPSSCREGTCGACETRVISGTPDHRDSVLSAKERDAGDLIMPCCSRSLTPRLVLDA